LCGATSKKTAAQNCKWTIYDCPAPELKKTITAKHCPRVSGMMLRSLVVLCTQKEHKHRHQLQAKCCKRFFWFCNLNISLITEDQRPGPKHSVRW
jgi:hypothetical protein